MYEEKKFWKRSGLNLFTYSNEIPINLVVDQDHRATEQFNTNTSGGKKKFFIGNWQVKNRQYH